MAHSSHATSDLLNQVKGIPDDTTIVPANYQTQSPHRHQSGRSISTVGAAQQHIAPLPQEQSSSAGARQLYGALSPAVTQPSQYSQQHYYVPLQPSPQSPPNFGYYRSRPHKYYTNQFGAFTPTYSPPNMALQAIRPNLPVYHSPQTDPTSSSHSPHDVHGRLQYAPLTQYQPQHQSTYFNHMPFHQPYLNANHGYSFPYQQTQPLQPQGSLSQNTGLNNMGMVTSPLTTQRQASQVEQSLPSPVSARPVAPALLAQRTGTCGSGGAAPGPIPASTPRVTQIDDNGVHWIQFEYSRERTKLNYDIRCDVNSVNLTELSDAHKDANTIYPKARSEDKPPGPRWKYENECNEIGWALAHLNPCLHGKRGLIQRAVDSWRNSSGNKNLQSRRVRRMNKQRARQANQAAQAPKPQPSYLITEIPPGPQSEDVAADHHAHALPSARDHQQHPVGGSSLGLHSDILSPVSSSTAPRPTSDFIANGYASAHGVPTQQLDRSPMGPSYQTSSTIDTSRRPADDPPTGERPAKRQRMAMSDTGRRTVTVKDRQRDNLVRVSVKTKNIDLDEMPDSFRREYSVFPRAHYSRQQTTRPLEEYDLAESPEAQVESLYNWGNIPLGEWRLPKMAQERKKQERQLNDLGQHITWGKPQLFSGRNLLLQTTLHEFRRQAHARFADGMNDVENIGDVRSGKREWTSFRNDILRNSQSPTIAEEVEDFRDIQTPEP